MYSQITRDELHRYFFRQLALDRWITLPNGVHCWIDGGEITRGPRALQGKHLQDLDGTNGISILRDTAPKTDEYQKLLASNHGDHYRTTREFFRKNLQGKAVMTVIDGEECPVFFTGRTWREIKGGLKRNPVKGELIAHLPDIVATGECTREPLYHARNDNTKEVFSFRKIIKTKNGLKTSIVDVLDREYSAPNPTAYSLVHEGSPDYTYRSAKQTKKPTTAKDVGFFGLKRVSGISPSLSIALASDVECLGNILSKEYEVVNIRIKD